MIGHCSPITNHQSLPWLRALISISGCILNRDGQIYLVAAAPFAFQIYVRMSPRSDSDPTKERSVLVEVSPETLTLTQGGQNKDRAELELAQRIAKKAAVEAIGVESESDCSIAQVGELPSEIRNRTATLQKNGVRVWTI